MAVAPTLWSRSAGSTDAVESFDRALAHDPSVRCRLVQSRGRSASISAGRARRPRASTLPLRSRPTLRRRTTITAMRCPSLSAMIDAIASYDRALALKPDYVDALNNRANALDQLGRLPEALASAEAALALAPDHMARWSRAACCCASCGAPPKRLRAASARSRSSPTTPTRSRCARDLLIDLERFEEAIATLDAIIALEPDDVAAKWNKSSHLSRPRPLPGRLAALRASLGRRQGPGAAWLPAAALERRTLSTARFWSGVSRGSATKSCMPACSPIVMARTPSVVFEVEPRLAPLFARSFPGVDGDRLPEPELYAGRSMRRSRWRASAATSAQKLGRISAPRARLSRCRRGACAGIAPAARERRAPGDRALLGQQGAGWRGIEERAARRFRGVAAAARLPFRRPAIRRHQRRARGARPRSRRPSSSALAISTTPTTSMVSRR